jgi:hypothetical protein
MRMHGEVGSRGYTRNILLGVIAVAVIATGIAIYIRTGTGPEQVSADSLSAPLTSPSSGGYIKLGDIKGEATDRGHEGWIDILSVSHSITRPMSSGISGSTRQRGSVTFGDVVLVKELDKS